MEEKINSKKKKLQCASGSARGLEDMEVGVKAAWMTGAKLKNKAHLQALPMRFRTYL